MNTLASYFNATNLAFMLFAMALLLNTTHADSAQNSIEILTADFDDKKE